LAADCCSKSKALAIEPCDCDVTAACCAGLAGIVQDALILRAERIAGLLLLIQELLVLGVNAGELLIGHIARDILRKHGNKRQPKPLIKIRDELVPRHVLEFAVVVGTVLVRHVPVHVVRIPPGVLQSLPEEPRLADAANFVAPRDDALLAILADQFAQSIH
jgi:hypothetical protein